MTDAYKGVQRAVGPGDTIIDTDVAPISDDSEARHPVSLNGLVYLDDPDEDAGTESVDGLHPDLVPKLEALQARLTSQQLARLRAVLVQYADIFADKDAMPPVARCPHMRIDLVEGPCRYRHRFDGTMNTLGGFW